MFDTFQLFSRLILSQITYRFNVIDRCHVIIIYLSLGNMLWTRFLTCHRGNCTWEYDLSPRIRHSVRRHRYKDQNTCYDCKLCLEDSLGSEHILDDIRNMDHRGILVGKCMYHRDTVRSIHTVKGCRHLGALLVKLVGKISLNSVLKTETIRYCSEG